MVIYFILRIYINIYVLAPLLTVAETVSAVPTTSRTLGSKKRSSRTFFNNC
jgi:hypothetical protein